MIESEILGRIKAEVEALATARPPEPGPWMNNEEFEAARVAAVLTTVVLAERGWGIALDGSVVTWRRPVGGARLRRKAVGPEGDADVRAWV